MSVAIGIYDLFAYTIPGILYLFIANEGLRLFGLRYVDINQVTSLAHILLIGVAAFVTGLVLDSPARLFSYRLLYRRKTSEEAVKRVASRYSSLNPQFRGEDWNVLLTLIRDNNHDLAQMIDRHEANSIMTRNFCLGFTIYALMQLILYIIHPSVIVHLAAAAGLALLAFLAFRISLTFHRWFYSTIFEYGLIHGRDLEQVLSLNRSKNNPVETKKAKKHEE